MRCLLVWIFGWASPALFAQDADSVSTTKRGFSLSVNSGTLIDSPDTGYSFSVVPSLALTDRLGIGAGVGFDTYSNEHAFPVFGQVRYDLAGRKNRFFVAMNAGFAWPQVKRSVEDSFGYRYTSGGRMLQPTVGYELQFGRIGVAFSLGAKYQRVTHHYEFPVWYEYSLWSGTGNEATTDIRFDNRCVYFGMGVTWR